MWMLQNILITRTTSLKLCIMDQTLNHNLNVKVSPLIVKLNPKLHFNFDDNLNSTTNHVEDVR
jgi:hypothetical protein